MKIPPPPYNEVASELLYALLTGGDCIGYQDLDIDSIYAMGLNYPDKAVYASIIVEADPTTIDKTRVIRFREHDWGSNLPTASSGIPLGHLSTYKVMGKHNLRNFQAISVEENKIHTLRIQYYG